jgi:hypothetical protein
MHELTLITLMMEAASTSEMLINFYQPTQHYNPEDSHLHELTFIQNLRGEKYLTSDRIRDALHCVCNDVSVEYS